LTQVAETTLARVAHLFDSDGPSYGGIVGTITTIDTVVRREARAGNGTAAWLEAARVAPSVPVLRRLSRHTEAALDASHPPAGLRAEMLERRPRLAAAVTLTETGAEAIDLELAAYQKRAVRELKE
jgi:heat shock protein HtpX